MPETKQILRDTRDRIAPPPDVLRGLERRRRHKENANRVAAAVLGIAVALVAVGGWFVLGRDTEPRIADRSAELGIFAPVAGRILYENEAEVGDLGYDLGLWALDPNGPSDTAAGPSVADDVASTLVPFPLDPQGFDYVTAIAWSRDGTELLFKRTHDNLFLKEYLYILHADGSETRLNSEPMYFANPGATISPDGERVVFAAQADHLGLYVIDAEGGRPTPLPYPAYGLPDSPTFSPDGSQIAYLVYGDDFAGAPHEYHVWVADADGSDAHEILVDDETRFSCGGLQWSPAGDRLACTEGGSDRNGDVDSIYTFAPDGSDFTRVIDGGASPYWSPDGTQIAFTRTEHGASAGLAIADADGSNLREFGFAASGPWHPGAAVQPVETPTPVETDSPQPVGPAAELYTPDPPLEDEVTLLAAPPWTWVCCFGPWHLVEDGSGAEFSVLADPRPVETGCRKGPAPADAEALAQSIRSDPDLDATAPVAASVGGLGALSMDVVAAPGASVCDYWDVPLVVSLTGVEQAWASVDLRARHRMRLYLLDLPEGLSARILAIAIVSQEDRFEAVLEAAAPIVDSFEFRAS